MKLRHRPVAFLPIRINRLRNHRICLPAQLPSLYPARKNPAIPVSVLDFFLCIGAEKAEEQCSHRKNVRPLIDNRTQNILLRGFQPLASPIRFSHVIISRLFPKQVNIAKHQPIIPEIIKQASIIEIHRYIAFSGHHFHKGKNALHGRQLFVSWQIMKPHRRPDQIRLPVILVKIPVIKQTFPICPPKYCDIILLMWIVFDQFHQCRVL